MESAQVRAVAGWGWHSLTSGKSDDRKPSIGMGERRGLRVNAIRELRGVWSDEYAGSGMRDSSWTRWASLWRSRSKPALGRIRSCAGPIGSSGKLARSAGEGLSKRGQTRRLIFTKVWVCQSLLSVSQLGQRLKRGSKGIVNVSPVRKSTQAK